MPCRPQQLLVFARMNQFSRIRFYSICQQIALANASANVGKRNANSRPAMRICILHQIPCSATGPSHLTKGRRVFFQGHGGIHLVLLTLIQ